MKVAIAWSLSHYIPLNGFDPRYRALFDHCPAWVSLHAWDNAKLAGALRDNAAARLALLKNGKPGASAVARAYADAFYAPNEAATARLPGDIELHHSALFPSMTRPFALLCEAFAPFFSAVGGPSDAARAFYAPMLENPLCLGIFSHVPETLAAFSDFFGAAAIDAKLFRTRIGISALALAQRSTRPVRDDSRPSFLASAAPEAEHLVLRAWPAILRACPGARLFLSGPRHESAQRAAGEISNSIIWIEDSLTNREQNNLRRAAHFYLSPGSVPDSAAVMQAMACGAVPVVSGAVAQALGLPESVPAGGAGLAERVVALWQDQARYAGAQAHSVAQAARLFDGAAYADDVWGQLRALWEPAQAAAPVIHGLEDCLVAPSDWSRLFEAPAQPVRRLHSGTSMVTALGGHVVCTAPGNFATHDWSVFAAHERAGAPPLLVADNIGGLDGAYLGAASQPSAQRRLRQWVARQLLPYPKLYRAAARLLHLVRRLARARVPAPPAQLVHENIFGLNIVRCGALYYGIPQANGAFSLKRVERKRYRLCFSAATAQEVKEMITAHFADAEHEAASVPKALVEQARS